MRILFAGGGTGGHLYPGLAIARALVRLRPSVVPVFVGARRGIEREILPATEFRHLLLDLHPLYRHRVWTNWRTLRGLGSAWRGLAALVAEERPRLIAATGGYAAAATLAYGRAAGIPTVLQEQNAVPGLTQRLFVHGAREVYLGFPEAERLFAHPRGTTFVDTGNPIESPPDPRPDRATARAVWACPPTDGTIVLIVGGSQGARALNEAAAEWVCGGVGEEVHLIWATGRADFPRYAALDGGRVHVRPYLAPIADAYAACDVAVTRAGAMTTAELCAWGIPAILVPLPSAAADHQTLNARALAAVQAAVHLPQRELTARSLAERVGALAADRDALARMGERALARGRPRAAESIAQRILRLVDA